MLADGEADLGVVLDGEARDCGLHMEPLGDDSLVVIGQAGGILAGRTALTYSEVAEHPLVGLDADSSLRRWIEKHLVPHAPRGALPHHRRQPQRPRRPRLRGRRPGRRTASRHRPPHQPLDVCELRDPWARRHHLLAWGTKDHPPSPATTALAEHLRQAALSEPPSPHRAERPRLDAARLKLVRVAVPVAAPVQPSAPSVPTVWWSVRIRRPPRPSPE
ncbi:hypothetical protein GCM10020000_03240 [Streptomyces olivoverticillatus]